MSGDKSGMSHKRLLLCGVVLLAGLGPERTSLAQTSSSSWTSVAPMPTARFALAAATVNQPLSFEPNRGQTDSRVRYLTRGPGYTLFLTGSGAVLSLARQPGRQRRIFPLPGPHLRTTMATRTATLELLPQGMSRHVQITVSRRLPGVVSYLIGKDPTKWHAGIPTYEQVTYHDVYPGIDLIFHGSDGQPEYDWVVQPGADPNGIRLRVAGASALSIDETDRLGMMTRLGRIVQGRPRIYQGRGGEIAGRLVLLGKDLVGIRVGRYDRSRRLVIDPQLQLAYSTYLGGSNGADATAVAVDGSGDAYVAGDTASTDFPICGTNSKCASPNTAIQSTNGGGTNYGNAFVSKLSPTGTELLYSTYLGGTGGDDANAIAVDSAGDAYVAGFTESKDFPVCGASPKCASPNTAIQSTNANPNGDVPGNAFVSKLSPTGTQLLYSTYLGGTNLAYASAIAVDSAGNAYVAGESLSTDFPVCGTNPKCASPNTAIQSTNANPNGTGNGNAFVTELDSSGTRLIYSTYLGGTGGDFANAIAVDSAGDAYVAGESRSTDFPVCGTSPKCASPNSAIQSTNARPSNGNAFVSKLSPTGTQLLYSTYLGGTGADSANAIAVDSAGNAYVAGESLSTDFPVCGTNPKCASPNTAIQSTYAGGTNYGNAFVSKLSPTGAQLVYSTYLGGTGGVPGGGIAGLTRGDSAEAIVVDSLGNADVAGGTASADFPVCGTSPKCASPNTAIQPTNANTSNGNAFVSQLSSGGAQLLYSTYLGGSGAVGDVASGIAVDSSGNAYVVGLTFSSDFPMCGTNATCVAPNTAIQSTNASPGDGNAFVSKLTLVTGTVPATPAPMQTPALATSTPTSSAAGSLLGTSAAAMQTVRALHSKGQYLEKSDTTSFTADCGSNGWRMRLQGSFAAASLNESARNAVRDIIVLGAKGHAKRYWSRRRMGSHRWGPWTKAKGNDLAGLQFLSSIFEPLVCRQEYAQLGTLPPDTIMTDLGVGTLGGRAERHLRISFKADCGTACTITLDFYIDQQTHYWLRVVVTQSAPWTVEDTTYSKFNEHLVLRPPKT